MIAALFLATALPLALQSATPLFIPPLRSRSQVEVPITPAKTSAMLDNLARQCGERQLQVITRDEVQVTCSYEPDYASRLSYITAKPRPEGPLLGYVRFAVVRGGGALRIQALRYAEFRAAGELRQQVSDDVTMLRDMIAQAQSSGS